MLGERGGRRLGLGTELGPSSRTAQAASPVRRLTALIVDLPGRLRWRGRDVTEDGVHEAPSRGPTRPHRLADGRVGRDGRERDLVRAQPQGVPDPEVIRLIGLLARASIA